MCDRKQDSNTNDAYKVLKYLMKHYLGSKIIYNIAKVFLYDLGDSND